MFCVSSTVAGGVNFSAAAPICTFVEMGPLSTAQNVAARVLGYSYSSLSGTADILLTLATAAGVALNQQIIVENRTGIASYTQWCGPKGLAVPRNFGVTDAVPVTTGATYVLLFSTANKADTGTFRVWYTHGDVDE